MTVVPASAEHLLAQLVSDKIDPNLIQKGQWPDIIRAAQHHHLAPILFYKLNQGAGDGNAVEALRQDARAATLNYIAQEAARWEVNDTLRSAEMSTVWIKGSVLAHTVYERPELRPMADLDVLVPSAQFEQARALLQKIGYQPSGEAIIPLPPEFAAKNDHDVALEGGAGKQIRVELHWHLLAPVLLPDEQLAWFWNQTHDIEIKGHTVTTLRTEAHLLYLCAHALLHHGAAQTRLITYCDLHFLISRCEVDWSLVVDQSASLQWTYAVERALATTMDYFGTEIPEHVPERLRNSRSSEEKVWQVEALAGENYSVPKMLRTLQGESILKVARFVRAVMFPPRSYMRLRYAIPPDAPVWLWYLRRWIHQFREILKAGRSGFRP